MLLNAIVEKLKHHSKNDVKGRQFMASIILEAVSWHLRYPLSYRDLEEMFLERGFEVDHSTINRWVLAYAPLLEKRLRQLQRPYCGSIRINETYMKIRGQDWMVPIIQYGTQKTIMGFEAILWLRKGFGFLGDWNVLKQNELIAQCFGIPKVRKV